MIIDIPNNISGKERRRMIEYLLVKYAMNLHENNKTQSAKWLGISLATFKARCRKYDEFKIEKRKYLTDKIKWALPNSFDECKKLDLYKYGNEELKKEIKSYYESN